MSLEHLYYLADFCKNYNTYKNIQTAGSYFTCLTKENIFCLCIEYIIMLLLMVTQVYLLMNFNAVSTNSLFRYSVKITYSR